MTPYTYCSDYETLGEMMRPHTQNPLPIEENDGLRGEMLVDTHPWTGRGWEVQSDPRDPRGRSRGSVVDLHTPRMEGADPGRFLTHPSRIVAPDLIADYQPQTFDWPHYIISWAPNPIVQRSFGQFTLAVDDMRHTTPKQILGYSTEALSQQEIADAAALRVRRALYGR